MTDDNTATTNRDEKFPNLARAQRLAFLFRRDIAKALRGENGLIFAGMIYCAISGGPNSAHSIETLTSKFHPDKQQRRDACQRILDDLQFRYESDIRKLEFAGDFATATLMRRQIARLRADLEQQVGKLAGRETIEQSAPDGQLPARLISVETEAHRAKAGSAQGAQAMTDESNKRR